MVAVRTVVLYLILHDQGILVMHMPNFHSRNQCKEESQGKVKYLSSSSLKNNKFKGMSDGKKTPQIWLTDFLSVIKIILHIVVLFHCIIDCIIVYLYCYTCIVHCIVSETVQELNERLRLELLELEGQIHHERMTGELRSGSYNAKHVSGGGSRR